jgi:hypothetical protein
MRIAALLFVFALLPGCNDPVLLQIERVRQGVCGCDTLMCAQDWLCQMPGKIPRARVKAEALARQTLVCFDKLSRAEATPKMKDEQPSI